MGEIITLGFIGGIAGFVIYSGGYWIDYKIKEMEKEEQAKRQEEDKSKFAPRPKVQLSGCSACQGPYKPPQYKYTIMIHNQNYESVPILEMRLEFNFKHVVAEARPQILLPGEGMNPKGELEIHGLEIHGVNKDGSTYDYQETKTTGLEKKFTFDISQANVNKEMKNLNVIVFYVEKWSEQKAAFTADIITDESLVLHSPRKAGKYHSVTGKYSYEINGIRYSENIKHEFIPQQKSPS